MHASHAAAEPPGRRVPVQVRLTRVIDGLPLGDDKKLWMTERWLDQVGWFDRKARSANLWHSTLRVIAIGGGVLVPGLVSLGNHQGWATPAAFVVSLFVATAVGLEGFFHFGERWRHFRRTAELLESEGWLFIEGGGRYKRHQAHTEFHERAFPLFATKVEEIIARDVDVYLTQIVQERQADRDDEEQDVEDYLSKGEHAGGATPQSTAAPQE